MANQPGKWETVVKKKGPISKSDVKRSQQKFYDNTAHQQFGESLKNPLQESSTIYGSLGEEKRKSNTGGPDKENEPQDKHPSFLQSSYGSPGKAGSGKVQGSSKTMVKKKTAKAPKPDPLHSAVASLNKLSGAELDQFISGSKEKFPGHPTVWLRDVASWFQMQVSGSIEKDLALRDQDPDFPTTQVPKDVIKSLKDLISSCSMPCLSGVLLFCTSSMLTEAQHGKSTIGYRVFCQVLLKQNPSLLKDKLSEILNGRNKTSESYQILMWIFSQSYDDLASCLQVWWKVMYPVLNVRHHTGLAIRYLETVLKTFNGKPIEKPMLNKDEFMRLLTAMFSERSLLAHSPSSKNTLVTLYSDVKKLYFTDDVGKYATKHFKSLLKELSTEDPPVRQELLDLLVMCLQSDPATFQLWKDMFRGNLVVSSVLLSHIASKKGSIQKELNSGRTFKSKIMLDQVFRDFLTILVDLHHKGEGTKPGFTESYHICMRNAGKGAKSSRKSSWLWKVLKYSSLLGLLCLCLDVWSNRGWEGSRSQKVAVHTGGDVFAAKVLNFTQETGSKTEKWLAKNVPYYYSNVHPHLKVAMDTTRVYVVNVSMYVYEKSEPVRTYFNQYMPIVLEKVEEYVAQCWKIISTQSIRLWTASYPYIKQGLDYGNYFVFSILPKVKENMIKSWWKAVESVYGLCPTTFDNVSVVLSTYWDQAVNAAPAIVERIQEAFLALFRSLSGCLQQGQNWIHANVLSFNTSPSASS